MNPSSNRLSTSLRARAVVPCLMILCAGAFAQSNPAPDAKALIAKMEETLGVPTKPLASLAIEGTFGVTIEGVNDGKPCVEGKFREIFLGEKLMRHTSDMGEHGLMESGATEAFVWEIEPLTGAKILAEADEENARRYAALLRGARPGALYRDVATAGTKTLDGREHVVLRMTPKTGKPDTWFVDPATGLVGRIDTALPTSEDADLVWSLGDDIDAQITFGDWKRIEGLLYPHRRSMKMGKATFVFTCAKIEPNAKLEPERFTPPEAVTKAKAAAAFRKEAPESRPPYEIVEREAQHVASIRVKSRQEDLSATLAVIFPEVIAHLNATGARMTGVPFTRYHGMVGEELDIEAGLPIAKPVAEKGRVKNSELPGGRTVVAWHTGPYEKLPAAHEALRAYLQANGLKARGGPWEIYWTDPGVVPDSSKWRTQLFMVVEN